MRDFVESQDVTVDRKTAIGASQLELEVLFSKYQLLDAMRADFAEDFTEGLEQLQIPVPFGLDLLTQIALHKRARIEVLVGLLKHHFKDETNPVQACADMIGHCVTHDLLDWVVREDPDGEEIGELVMRYDIRPETQEMIDQFQYPLPMIEQPRPVTHNRQTGYRTIRGSIILRKNHHEEDVCLDHINRMNAQKLRLNPDVVAFIQNSWKNLERQKPGESYEEFQQRRKAFRKYDRTSREVIDALMLQGDGFWLTHKYDKRGRTYAQGYAVTYQGNSWNKACVDFAKAEKLKEG